jgi:hypothetical protein
MRLAHTFALGFVLWLVLRLDAATIPEIVAKAKPAAVEIIALDQSGNPIKTGTGFFLTSDASKYGTTTDTY